MERLFWVALDFPCIATFLYIVPGWMTSGHLVPFLPSLAIGIALALTASLCLQHGLRPDFPTILSMTLVLHLALPEELTLPLVVLLAIVVVLDLQIPLGPLLYFMVALGACLLYELPPIIGILIHVHLVVLLIIRPEQHSFKMKWT